MSLPFSKKKVKQIVTDFESENGNRLKDFSLKEITIMFHDDISKRCEKIENTLDAHMAENKKQYEDGLKFIGEHDKVISQITSQLEHLSKEMPAKGFCEKIEKLHSDLCPEGETSIRDKVETLWYDRKIMRWLLATSLGALITGLVTLGIGFWKGSF